MKSVRTIVLSLLAVAVPQVAEAALPAAERAALVAIYQSTNGDGWIEKTHWLREVGTECNWFGVRCDPSQKSVVGLSLCDNNLTGTLPPEIGALTNLAELELCWNAIGGALPSQLAQLSKLTQLDLSDNHVEGELPPSLFTLVSLTSLRLGGNRLGGTIPSAVGQLANLTELDLSNNQFQGEAPSSLQSLTKLGDGALDLRYNAIRISNGSLRSFLERKQAGGDVLGTQTLPPKNLKVQGTTDPFSAPGDVIVSWDPPVYVSDLGGYQVFASLPSTGEIVSVQTTASKTHLDIVMRGLPPLSRNYFAKTVTHPHGRQQNTLTSDPTETVYLYVPPMVSPSPRPVVGTRPGIFVQTGTAPAPLATFAVVNIGSQAADIALLQSGDFFTLGPSTFVLSPGGSETVTIFPKAQPAGNYEGKIFVTGDGLTKDVIVPVRLVSTAAPEGTVVGEPALPRLDVAAVRETNPKGSATFTNSGSATLQGVARSDVEWLIPQSSPVTIPAGATGAISFTIDRAKRPDATGQNGAAFSGALTLDYVNPGADASKLLEREPQSGASGSSTSLVTIVDTVKPPVRGASITPLDPGELALFVPGIEHRVRAIGPVLSDISIANAFGTASVGDIRLFFTPASVGALSSFASLNAVAPQGSVLLADVVSTVYGEKERSGSFQLRSMQASRLLTRARLVVLAPGRGMLGTPLPVFLSTRSANAGEAVRLPGLGVRASEADLVLQETSGAPASVRIEYLDAAGSTIAVIDPVTVGAFGSVEYRGGVPTGAAAALLTNRGDSAGRIVAYGVGHDAASGDAWVVNDWAMIAGFELSSAQKIVYAPLHDEPTTRRRPVRRGSPAKAAGEAGSTRTTLELTLHNAALSPAGVLLTYYENGLATGPKALSLGAMETLTIEDAVGTLFGRRETATGWLSVEPRRGAPVSVGARVVTTGESPWAASVPVTALSSGLRLGQMQLFAGIDDARQETIDRKLGGATSTTLGFAESGGRSATVRVTMTYFDGSLIAARTTSKEFSVGPHSVLLLPNIARAIGGEGRERELGDLRDIQLEVRVVAGDGAVTPFVIATDCGSGDASVRIE